MALVSYALTSLASLRAYMRNQSPMDADLISIYHDASVGATAATVQVTTTGITLIVVGGANAGTETPTFVDEATISAMVTAINALAKGWVAVTLGSGSEASSDLNEAAKTSAYAAANTQYLRGTDSYMLEQAANAATDRIELHCGRRFASATYSHRFNGTGTVKLILRQRPVTEVKRVAIGLTEALTIKNTSSDARRATVSNDGTSLNLVVVGGANDGTSTIAIGSNTVSQLVTLIVAEDSGWTATSGGSTQDNWPATELVQHEHRLCLDQNLPLAVPDQYIDAYTLNAQAGILTRTFGSGVDSFFPYRFGRGEHYSTMPHAAHNPGGHMGIHWPPGNFNILVEYTAGESTIPYDLEQTANELAANIIRSGSHDGNVTALSGPEFSESYRGEGAFTPEIARALARYRMRPSPAYMDA